MDSTETHTEVVSREGVRAAHGYCDSHSRDRDFEPSKARLRHHIRCGLLGKETLQRWLAIEAGIDPGDQVAREQLVEEIAEEAWRNVEAWGNQDYSDYDKWHPLDIAADVRDATWNHDAGSLMP